jgi:hypothetical protein
MVGNITGAKKKPMSLPVILDENIAHHLILSLHSIITFHYQNIHSLRLFVSFCKIVAIFLYYAALSGHISWNWYLLIIWPCNKVRRNAKAMHDIPSLPFRSTLSRCFLSLSIYQRSSWYFIYVDFPNHDATIVNLIQRIDDQTGIRANKLAATANTWLYWKDITGAACTIGRKWIIHHLILSLDSIIILFVWSSYRIITFHYQNMHGLRLLVSFCEIFAFCLYYAALSGQISWTWFLYIIWSYNNLRPHSKAMHDIYSIAPRK